jgi:hypothetical protein
VGTKIDALVTSIFPVRIHNPIDTIKPNSKSAILVTCFHEIMGGP